MLARCGLALSAVLFLTAAGPAPLGLSQFTEFPLQSGINRIAKFSQDGRTATITRAWRDNGNAWGFNVYLVILPGTYNSSGVVGWVKQKDGSFAETITDGPHTGEDYVRAVLFGRGMIDGKMQTLLLTATRQTRDAPIPLPAVTNFEIYRLANDGFVGTTPDYFDPVAIFTSTEKYCNAYMALLQELKIPLPKDYEGPKSKDGC